MDTTQATFADRLLRPDEVCVRLGVSRATFNRWRAAGSFPQPVHVGPRSPRWRESDLTRWVDEQAAAAGRAQA